MTTTNWANDDAVIDAATRLATTLGDDPNHTVAAAAMDLSGTIHAAVNNHHFTGGPCAELVVLGLAAVLKRKIARHRAWMARAYALGMGAGTQVVTTLHFTLAFGNPDELTRDLLMLAGWVINIAVAEWGIRNRSN